MSKGFILVVLVVSSIVVVGTTVVSVKVMVEEFRRQRKPQADEQHSRGWALFAAAILLLISVVFDSTN